MEKSPWRIEFERRNAEDAAKRRVQRQSRPPQMMARCERPKREPRKNNPRNLTKCPNGCGRNVMVEGVKCFKCKVLVTDRKTCTADGCTKLLNSNNKYGRCRTHGKELWRIAGDDRARGPRKVCSFAVDGMRCTHVLNRTSKTGMCWRHNPKWPSHRRLAKMEAING